MTSTTSGTTQIPTGKPLLTLTRERMFLASFCLIHESEYFEIVAEAGLWTIELHNGEDNRMSHDLIDRALKPALDIVEREWRDQWRDAQASSASKVKEPANKSAGRGALIIIGKRDQNKFFSNGLCPKDPDIQSEEMEY